MGHPVSCLAGFEDLFVVSPVPKGSGVKCRDMLYILSPDILYTCCHPVKRRQALLESNLTEE
jgi:hypothetical protein